jgi:hypothetical protein
MPMPRRSRLKFSGSAPSPASNSPDFGPENSLASTVDNEFEFPLPMTQSSFVHDNTRSHVMAGRKSLHSQSSRGNSAMTDPKDSAPDLELLGDQVTFQPRGYIQPLQKIKDGDKERNLVENVARFRSSPLE